MRLCVFGGAVRAAHLAACWARLRFFFNFCNAKLYRWWSEPFFTPDGGVTKKICSRGTSSTLRHGNYESSTLSSSCSLLDESAYHVTLNARWLSCWFRSVTCTLSCTPSVFPSRVVSPTLNIAACRMCGRHVKYSTAQMFLFQFPNQSKDVARDVFPRASVSFFVQSCHCSKNNVLLPWEAGKVYTVFRVVFFWLAQRTSSAAPERVLFDRARPK